MDEGQHTSLPEIPWDSQSLCRRGWPHARTHTLRGRQTPRLFLAVVLVTLDPPQMPRVIHLALLFSSYGTKYAAVTFTLLRRCINQKLREPCLSFIFWLPFILVSMGLSPEWLQFDGFQGQSTRFCLRGLKPAVNQIIGVRILCPRQLSTSSILSIVQWMSEWLNCCHIFTWHSLLSSTKLWCIVKKFSWIKQPLHILKRHNGNVYPRHVRD